MAWSLTGFHLNRTKEAGVEKANNDVSSTLTSDSSVFLLSIEDAKSKGLASTHLGTTSVIISPKEYGFMVSEWTVENANSFLSSILKIPPMPFENNPSLIARIEAGKVSAQLIFFGFYLAIYWTYAARVLNFRHDIDAETGLLDGLMTGLMNLKFPTKSGETIVENLPKDMKDMIAGNVIQSFMKFRDAMEFDFDISNLQDEKTFATAMSFLYEIYKPLGEFSILEQQALQPLISSAPVDMYTTLSKICTREGNKIRIQEPR